MTADQKKTELKSSPGNMLRKAREEAGLSPRQVADQLCMVAATIIALEEDRYDCFNGEIFAKGYLRSYARLLDLDVESLLLAYTQLPKKILADEPELCPRSDQHYRRSWGVGAQSSRLYWGVAASCFIALGLWWWQGAAGLSEPAEQAQLLAETNHSVVVDQAPVNLIAEQRAIETASNEQKTEPLILPASSQLPELRSANAPAVSQQEAPTQLAQKDLLNFSFSGDCWVEVKDTNDKVLIAGLKRADETLHLSGKGPFRILLGYAPAVELNFNGEPVTVNSNSRTHSARLVVGRS